MAGQPQIKTLAVDTEVLLGASPFGVEQPARVKSLGAAVLYGIEHPGIADETRVLRIGGDGTTTQFSSAKYSLLASADVQATITAANRLRVVVLVKGVGNKILSVLNRVGSAATPGAGEFKVSGAGPVLLDVGTAPTDGQVLEVLIMAAADLIQLTGGNLTANVPYEIECPRIITCSTAACYLEALNKGGGS